MKYDHAVSILIAGVILMGLHQSTFGGGSEVRKPAVAGAFYESNPALLRSLVLRYLSDAQPLDEPSRLLICPHAGFVFSGSVAARGYATLDADVKRVIIIGPSHHRAFTGIAVPKVAFYETPLGTVPVDKKGVEQLKGKPGVIEADGFDDPEHCLEVQLPFLQVRLTGFTIVPVLAGKADPAAVASLLLPLFDGKTALVASSDLSHYESQQAAKTIDSLTAKTILDGNLAGPIDACGDIPIRVVMHIAKKMQLRPVMVDMRTSFETAPQHCPESRVVGYAAIAYVSDDANKVEKEAGKAAEKLTSAHKKYLLDVARRSLEAAVKGLPFHLADDIPDAMREARGCFVTLTKNGALRGCIGYIEPIKPLVAAVVDNAKNAALSDPRFAKVTPAELGEIKVEVSVLTKPLPMQYDGPEDLLAQLVPKRDGVILSRGFNQSTYLPQVWEQLPDKVQFLEQLSLKGGMPRDGWKTADVRTYQAEHFSE